MGQNEMASAILPSEMAGWSDILLDLRYEVLR